MKVVIVPTECDRKPLCKPKPEFMSLHGFETCTVKAESAFQNWPNIALLTSAKQCGI